MSRPPSTTPSRFLRRIDIAHAHSGTQSYIYLDLRGDRPRGNVQFPVRDVNRILGTDLADDPNAAPEGLEEHIDRLFAYAKNHLIFDTDAGRPMELLLEGWRYLGHANGSYAIVEYALDRATEDLPKTLSISYDALIEADHHHEGLLIIKTSKGWGRLSLDESYQYEYNDQTRNHVVSLPDRPWPLELGASIQGLGLRVWRKSRRAFGSR